MFSTINYSGDHIKENEMAILLAYIGGDEKSIQHFGEKIKPENQLEDIDIEGRIILK